MPSVQDRRLQADFEKVNQLVAESGGTLVLISVTGNPPAQYVIEYHCRSLVKDAGGQMTDRREHRVEIWLGAHYPFEKPNARMITPVFNPHVFPDNSICLGSRWSATESLDALVLRIGALLQFDPKVLDFNSLANNAAGTWARQNLGKLPLDTVSFRGPKAPRPRIQWL